jgi:hypothetical protein
MLGTDFKSWVLVAIASNNPIKTFSELRRQTSEWCQPVGEFGQWEAGRRELASADPHHPSLIRPNIRSGAFSPKKPLQSFAASVDNKALLGFVW